MLKRVALILLGAAIGAAAVGLVASQTGGGHHDVRISVQKLESGAVEVALQEAGEDGAWGERQRPELGNLPADAASGRWFNSSPIAVGGPAGPEHTACLVHHGDLTDEFWLSLTRNAIVSSANIGIDLTVKGDSDPEEQARLIRECVEEGVRGIATSLPNVEALRGAIGYAQESGVLVLTYNSGRSDAESLGVPVHVSLDEAALGRQAGEAFSEAGVTGTVLCVLHEPDNAGLEERCDALEGGYTGGEVERFSVAGVAEIERSTEQMTERLREGGVGGLLTLNSALMNPSAEAVAAAESDAKVAAVGTVTAAEQVAAGKVFLALTDQPWFQSDYVLMSLKNFLSGIDLGLSVEAIGINPTTLVEVAPIVLDRENSQRLLDELERFIAEQFGTAEPG